MPFHAPYHGWSVEPEEPDLYAEFGECEECGAALGFGACPACDAAWKQREAEAEAAYLESLRFEEEANDAEDIPF